MFYTLKFNAALAGLGVNPSHVPPDLRVLCQNEGKARGCTPQEAVLILLSQLPYEIAHPADWRIAELWINERKVRIENPAMHDVMKKLGWGHLLV
jgi:hypothetical protein